MRRISLILLLLLPAITMMAQLDERLSERDLSGTARYVGMSGAMTAVGGDPSSVRDNPAGLGVYRRMEVLVTGDMRIDGQRRVYGSCPEASWVINFGCHNFMLSTHRVQSYGRTLEMTGGADASLGALIASSRVDLGIDYPQDAYHSGSRLWLDESGYVREYNADWALNIVDKFYLGFGVRLQNYRFISNVNYRENYASGDYAYLANLNSVEISGIGSSAAFGMLWRPTQWLRLGLGYTTPSINSLRQYTSGHFEVPADGNSVNTSYSGELSSNIRDFYAPHHLSLGVAFQLTTWGVLSTQYDFTRGRYRADRHSWRIGGEFIPVPGLYLNAGYGFESVGKYQFEPTSMAYDLARQDTHSIFTRATQCASAGIGWRGQYTIVQLAYQYRWQALSVYAHEQAQPYNDVLGTHRVVLTLGWHN